MINLYVNKIKFLLYFIFQAYLLIYTDTCQDLILITPGILYFTSIYKLYQQFPLKMVRPTRGKVSKHSLGERNG